MIEARSEIGGKQGSVYTVAFTSTQEGTGFEVMHINGRKKELSEVIADLKSAQSRLEADLTKRREKGGYMR